MKIRYVEYKDHLLIDRMIDDGVVYDLYTTKEYLGLYLIIRKDFLQKVVCISTNYVNKKYIKEYKVKASKGFIGVSTFKSDIDKIVEVNLHLLRLYFISCELHIVKLENLKLTNNKEKLSSSFSINNNKIVLTVLKNNIYNTNENYKIKILELDILNNLNVFKEFYLKDLTLNSDYDKIDKLCLRNSSLYYISKNRLTLCFIDYVVKPMTSVNIEDCIKEESFRSKDLNLPNESIKDLIVTNNYIIILLKDKLVFIEKKLRYDKISISKTIGVKESVRSISTDEKEILFLI